MPVPVLERLRELAPNLAGLKVSDKPFEAVEPYLLEGLDVFVGAEALVPRAWSAARRARSRASPRSSRSGSSRSSASRSGDVAELRRALDRFPFQAAAKYVLGAARSAGARGRARAAARADATTRSGSWSAWLESL